MQNQDEVSSSGGWNRHAGWGVPVLVFVLAALAAGSLIYTVRDHRQTRELAASNQALGASLVALQTQLQAVSDKLNTMAATPQPIAPAVKASSVQRPAAFVARKRGRAASPRLVARRRPVEDPRWKQFQYELSEHQKQLSSTREEVEKTRADLQGRLSSTRDELNGSIARTHEDVVALQKRGERNYYEFNLNKSKQFHRVGPMSLSLRKVNFKKKSYDLGMMVDDFQLNKKSVNLYEPIWITLTDRPQPVELVVNRISKDQVQGYLSEPKYRKSDLSASAAPSDKPPSAATPR
jgi:hypothetical protein